MIVTQHPVLDERAAVPPTCPSAAGPELDASRAGAGAPTSGLTPADEALLGVLEVAGDEFVDDLVDELWGRFDAPAVPFDEETGEAELEADGILAACGPTDPPGLEIVRGWASSVLAPDPERESAQAWWCRGNRGTAHASFDCLLISTLLDLDDQVCGDTGRWRTLLGCLALDSGRSCDHNLHRSATGRLRCQGGPSADRAWLLSTTRYDGLTGAARPSRLWHMVDELAKVYRVETYDREDVLRVLIGHIGGRELFAGDDLPYLFSRPDAATNRPRLLTWLGTSVVDYFRAWSVILVGSHGRRGSPAPGTDWRSPAPARILVPTTRCGSVRPALNPCQTNGGQPTMPKLTFYPVGNADTFVIDLAGSEKIIFDYADRRNRNDKDDKRCDLPAELRKDLGTRTDFDVAVFTHLDEDHYDGMTDFFYLEHDKKFQGKTADGKERIKMTEMWVPAAVLTETLEKEKESQDIQSEAWHRLKNKKGILVFSRPDSLKDAIEMKGIKYDEVKHLIIDAGKTVPTFTQAKHGVEFWVHSPHAHRQNKDEVVIRNDHALVLLAAFKVGGVETKVQLFVDAKHEVIADIVAVTKKKKNEARLEWDVFKISHHCSYLSLGPEKGKTKTEPVDEIKWLFEDQGHAGGIIVSTSDPIPSNDEVNDPPHRQAAKYYKDVADDKDGEFKVTMEHPEASDPKPLVIEITADGAARKEGKAQPAAAKSLTEAIAAARGASEPPQTRVGFGQ